MGKLGRIVNIGLSYNQLSGNIPSEMGNLRTLQTLYLHNNALTGVPSSISNLTTTSKFLFPNPMSSIPYDVFAQNPSAGLTETNWTNLLEIPVLSKRQLTSSLSTDELIAMCPLNNVQDASVPAGCVAGIYQKYCLNLKDLGNCHNSYNTVVAASFFKPLGVCAAWKFGPRSSTCVNAILSFKYALPYMTLTSTHASDFATTIFGSQKYAPCVNTDTVKCIW